VTVRDAAVPVRLSSLRIGPAATPRRPGESRGPLPQWAPAFAGVTQVWRASKASNAPKRMRQAGKRSEAAHQATREPGSAGRPVAPPRGDRRASAV